MYKVYGNSKKSGWKMLYETESIVKAGKVAGSLKAEEYSTYLIKESDWEGDRIIDRKALFIEPDEEMER